MNLLIGADHRGYACKEYIKSTLTSISWIDVGCFSKEPCDYPLFATAAAEKMQQKVASAAVLLCGSGIGMTIAANRYKGIFAALVWNVEVAKQAKQHENANIIVLPTDYITVNDGVQMIQAWLSESFLQGRYAQRCAMIDDSIK